MGCCLLLRHLIFWLKARGCWSRLKEWRRLIKKVELTSFSRIGDDSWSGSGFEVLCTGVSLTITLLIEFSTLASQISLIMPNCGGSVYVLQVRLSYDWFDHSYGARPGQVGQKFGNEAKFWASQFALTHCNCEGGANPHKYTWTASFSFFLEVSTKLQPKPRELSSNGYNLPGHQVSYVALCWEPARTLVALLRSCWPLPWATSHGLDGIYMKSELLVVNNWLLKY